MKIVIGVFFVIALIVAAYFYFAENVNAPIQEENTTSTTPQTLSDALPEGVSVIEKNGERVLRDERVGYEMQIPEDIRLKTEKNIVLFYSNEPDLPVLGGIEVYKNIENLSLDEWLENLNKEVFYTFYDQREKIKFQDLETIRIPVEGEAEYYDYFFRQGDKIVGVTLIGKDYSGKYLENFKVLN